MNILKHKRNFIFKNKEYWNVIFFFILNIEK